VKFSLVALTLILCSSAHAATVVLGCGMSRTMVFEGVRSISVTNDQMTLVEETTGGADKAYQGTLVRVTAGVGSQFHLPIGVEVTISEDLLSGVSKVGTVELSTYDYPYEKMTCSRSQ
jgi:hypothetical protein